MVTSAVTRVLDVLAMRPDRVAVLKDVPLGNGNWLVETAGGQTRAALAAIGAAEQPITLIHGDFAEWNVHYRHGRLAGVIDFGLTHQDTRPYELAIARTYRAPETADAHRGELARLRIRDRAYVTRPRSRGLARTTHEAATNPTFPGRPRRPRSP